MEINICDYWNTKNKYTIKNLNWFLLKYQYQLINVFRWLSIKMCYWFNYSMYFVKPKYRYMLFREKIAGLILCLQCYWHISLQKVWYFFCIYLIINQSSFIKVGWLIHEKLSPVNKDSKHNKIYAKLNFTSSFEYIYMNIATKFP